MSMYKLGPGDVIPFTGTEKEAERNIATHDWERVPSGQFVPIPERWARETNIAKFPEFVQQCASCGAIKYDSASRYPCGKAVRLGPGEFMRGSGSIVNVDETDRRIDQIAERHSAAEAVRRLLDKEDQ